LTKFLGKRRFYNFYNNKSCNKNFWKRCFSRLYLKK